MNIQYNVPLLSITVTAEILQRFCSALLADMRYATLLRT